MNDLEPPFPWFGGKRRVAAEVWARFGNVQNYVEPFFGSGAVLLGRPKPSGVETVNDLDGYVANFWRSIKHSPHETAEWADNPVNENDLHARHVWLLKQRETLRARLEGDPEWHDPKIAGWWVWGVSCWIGGGFCSGEGGWWVDENGQLVRRGDNGLGVSRRRVYLTTAGMGVRRQRPHLSDNGQGVNRKRRLISWFNALADRLRYVRVCSGDWARVCGQWMTHRHNTTAVFLDPPYSDAAGRDPSLYAVDSQTVAHDVREWAIANGDNPKLRIALCGYEGEYEMPTSWDVYKWSAGACFGGQTGNGKRERIWFSPHCMKAAQLELAQ